MRNIIVFIVIAVAVLCATSARAFTETSMRLTYEEVQGEDTSTKEYLIDRISNGWRIQLFNHGIKRVIVVNEDLDTRLEDFENPATGDRLTFSREGENLRLSGSFEGKDKDKTFEADGLWYGSVLLLRDAVLQKAEEVEFFVTKPETERVIKLVALRQDVETVEVDGVPCEAVKYKYTVPGFQGMFWKSYYWYRVSDGLLVKTEETRGMPGTPKVHTRLVTEQQMPAQPAVAALP